MSGVNWTEVAKDFIESHQAAAKSASGEGMRATPMDANMLGGFLQQVVSKLRGKGVNWVALIPFLVQILTMLSQGVTVDGVVAMILQLLGKLETQPTLNPA